MGDPVVTDNSASYYLPVDANALPVEGDATTAGPVSPRRLSQPVASGMINLTLTTRQLSALTSAPANNAVNREDEHRLSGTAAGWSRDRKSSPPSGYDKLLAGFHRLTRYVAGGPANGVSFIIPIEGADGKF